MNLTPKEILEKEFGKKFNGYDPEQVDEFLDSIIKQFESLIEENENVIAQNESLKSDLERYKQKSDKIDNVEEKLMAAVVTAQRNASIYIERAEAQASKIMDLASENARAIMESTQIKLATTKEELNKYEKLISDYKKRYKAFLDEQFAALDTKFDDELFHVSSANELSKQLNELSMQMADVSQSEVSSIHLSDILKQSKDQKELDLQQATTDLKDIVNEIIEN